MPTPTFFRLPPERRERLVSEAIVEFSDRRFGEASLSQIVARAGIAKGSVYQYFTDKLDLYRWLLVDEVPRRKRAFLERATGHAGDLWAELETYVERSMAFLVEEPRLARITAAAADPTADEAVRGLHEAVCEAGNLELRALLDRGRAAGLLSDAVEPEIAMRFVAAIVGPGLTEIVLHEIGASLHEVLASEKLRRRLDAERRRRLAKTAVRVVRHGVGRESAPSERAVGAASKRTGARTARAPKRKEKR